MGGSSEEVKNKHFLLLGSLYDTVCIKTFQETMFYRLSM